MQLPPTLFKPDEMLRLRSILNGVDVEEEQIVLTMWQLKLSPQSVPVTVREVQLSRTNFKAMIISILLTRLTGRRFWEQTKRKSPSVNTLTNTARIRQRNLWLTLRLDQENTRSHI